MLKDVGGHQGTVLGDFSFYDLHYLLYLYSLTNSL